MDDIITYIELGDYNNVLNNINYEEINELVNGYYTLLYYAVITEDEKIIQLLLDNGADSNIYSHNEYTDEMVMKPVIYYAIEYDNYNITKLLLKHGANPNGFGYQTNNNDYFEKNCPIYYAIINKSYSIIELLIDYEASYIIYDYNNELPSTILHLAVENNDYDMVMDMICF